MTDLRTKDRIQTSLQATILGGDDASPVSCVIKDISAAGAKIEVDAALPIPPVFKLVVGDTGETLHAELRWRLEHKIGVRFAESCADEPCEQTRDALIVENRKLREALESLATRLTQLGEHVDLPTGLMKPVCETRLALHAPLETRELSAADGEPLFAQPAI